MPHYRVYSGAPSFAQLMSSSSVTYQWITTSSSNNAPTSLPSNLDFRHDPSWLIPVATMDTATQRISEMYKNVIFDDDELSKESLDLWMDIEVKEEGETQWDESKSRMLGEDSNEGSLISWPPTNREQIHSRTSFARSIAVSRAQTEIETQGDNSISVSYAHTSTSSIGAFPTFVIILHTLSPLASLVIHQVSSTFSRKVNLLVAVLEVDGPDTVTIRKGKDAGKEVTVLKLVVGDETGAVCKITAWRDVAERWSGQDGDESAISIDTRVGTVKRGDIVYLTNISATAAPSVTDKDTSKKPSLSFSASPFLNSTMNICYRTLPSTPSDKYLRPDLRLAASDPGLRRVSDVVEWFLNAVGLSND